MIILNFNNLRNLNVSLQVGDGVYARKTETQPGAEDLQATELTTPPSQQQSTGSNYYVGILRNIDDLGNNQYDLHVDDSVTGAKYVPGELDFIMFSKFSQGDSGLLGYYAEAKFVNDSKEKAELFAVSSEIIINSN
tara:strand:+ start:469 stop:876 length:408 start_codon:yes stop_codon:yes gene_type:complete